MADPTFPRLDENTMDSVLRHSLAVLLATTALGVASAHALDGTWTGASSSDWVDGTNWSTTPTVPDITANFTNNGAPTVVNVNGPASIAAIFFHDTAPSYTININDALTVNNNSFGVAAVFNMSSVTQTLNVFSSLTFEGTTSASRGTGPGVIYNNSGTISFFENSTTGNAAITNDGILQFRNNSTALGTIQNNARMDFFDNAKAGGTITNAATGILTFNNNVTADFLHIVNNGDLSFNDSASAVGVIVTTDNGGTTRFTGASTAGSARFITNAGGTFDISTLTSAGLTVGSIEGAGNYVLGSKTLTTGGNDLGTTVDGVISGVGGGLTTVGIGYLTLTNTNTYTGATTVSGGTLALAFSGSIANSSSVTVNSTFNIDGSTLPFSMIRTLAGSSTGVVEMGDNVLVITNGSTEFAGSIQGIGGVTLSAGTQVLSGVNTYTGNTTVNGGTLVVDGSTAASVLTTVNAGATLAGSGTVGSTDIAGGTLAPGSAGGSLFGPLTVAGSLSFTSASTYMVQVSPTNAGRTIVNGSANLGGAQVSAVFQPGTYVAKQYTILTSADLGGTTFNPTVLSNNPNLNTTLSYDSQNVFLDVQLNFATPNGPLSGNQQNVANALTNFFNSTGGIPAAFASLNAAGLTIASGELGTGIIQSAARADDFFLNLLLDPTIAGRAGGFAPVGGATGFAAEDDEALAYAKKRLATRSERDAYAMAKKAPAFLSPQSASPWSVWGAGYGGSANIDGNAVVGSNNVTARAWGVVGGADYRVTPNTLLGFALAGGGTNYSLANDLGRGSSNLFQAGAFGRHNFGPAYISGALNYGWHDVTTNRTVMLAGTDVLQARFRAETFSGRFEGGYRYANPVVALTPYAAVQFTSVRLPGYAEQVLAGAGTFALTYAGQTTTATRTELGLRTDKSFAVQDGMLTLRGRAAWAHDYNNDRAITALFQTLPGTNFIVNGARPNADAALVSAGAEMKWLSGFSLAGTFEGEFSGNYQSYAGKAVAKYSW